MIPGKELDALIAEKVMGLEPWPEQDPRWKCKAFKAPILLPGQIAKPCEPPDYSTDIAAAWNVVEKIDLFGTKITERYPNIENVLMLFHRTDQEWVIADDRSGPEIVGQSAPHVICLAALKVVGHEIK